ncbi:MAG: DUF4968 domain-containing protein, partial [Flavobacteriaceae bacterium]|nr:DUF4968 domain-containing protein [Flavobacteriaceae bacterium]
METNGYEKTHISSKVVDEGTHNESFWRDQFEDAILYLFKSAIKPPRTFKKARIEDGDFLNVQVSDGEYHILFYNSKIVETTFIPLGEKTTGRSHAVVMKPEHTKTSFSENSESALLQTEGISVKIQKDPFNISYWYKGEEVISEKNGYRRTNDFETIQFNLTEDEVLYGTGERALPMNRRGYRLKLYNKPDYGYETHSELMNYCMPLVVSSREYALHFDNIPLGFIDLDSKQDNTLTYETISGRKTYQVVVGDSWPDMIDKYTDLTGKQPMPPRWILGNFSSRFGYHSEREVEHTIDLFKKDSIPVDAVIIDIYWFGKDIKGSMGNLSFYKDSFPDPERMIRNLKQEGVKTVLVSEPFILTTSHRWKEAVKNAVLATDSLDNPGRFDFYFGNTGLVDVFKPEARQWFWNIYKDLADLGVQGVWGDLGEPEMHPSWLIHATGTADAVHNSYGHEWAKLVYEGYQKDFPDERPFILMRAGSSGSQHYGLIPWSGDVNRSWGGLQSQPAIALQMGMQGLGYMHSDLGGFAGDNLDDELYVRWLQYGIFQPVFRPHAQETVPSEPVFRSDKAKHLAKRAIELRYKLLPYNYTLAFENSRSGVPLMRPLLFEEPENNMLLTMADTYLWGADFLVSPVMEPEIREVPVYFPGKSDWFDFYTGKKYMGGSTIAVNTVEDH